MIVDRLLLEQIWEALDAAHTFHTADDIRTQAKNIGGTHRPSNLTRRLENALNALNEVFTEGASDE